MEKVSDDLLGDAASAWGAPNTKWHADRARAIAARVDPPKPKPVSATWSRASHMYGRLVGAGFALASFALVVVLAWTMLAPHAAPQAEVPSKNIDGGLSVEYGDLTFRVPLPPGVDRETVTSGTDGLSEDALTATVNRRAICSWIDWGNSGAPKRWTIVSAKLKYEPFDEGLTSGQRESLDELRASATPPSELTVAGWQRELC